MTPSPHLCIPFSPDRSIGCTPTKCGRVFVDNLFDDATLDKMRALAEKSM